MDGVFYRADRKKWIAMLNYDRQRIHLGQFNTFEEARATRNIAAKKHAQAVAEAAQAFARRVQDALQENRESH